MSEAGAEPGVPRRPRSRIAIRFAIRLALLGVCVGLFLRFADVRSLGSAIREMSIATFAIAMLLDWGFYVVESWRLRRLSLRRYTFMALWRSRMAAGLVTNVLPGMASGELLRIFMIDRYRPGNKLYVGLLLLANRVYGLLALASLFLVAFAIDRQRLPTFVGAHLLPIVIGCVAILPTPLLLRIRPVRGAMVRLIRRLRGRVKRIAYTVFNATGHFCDPTRWALALASSTLSNALLIGVFWVTGRAVGADLTLTEWAVCLPLAAFASFLPIGFGSIGPQDATFVIIGKLTGHPIERLLAASVLIHVIQIAATAPGLLYLSDTRAVISEAGRAGLELARRARGKR